jgi:hypothetical protein
MTLHDGAGEGAEINGANAEESSEKEGMKRIHVSFPATLAQRLEEIRKLIHASSITDTLKEAIKVYAFLLKAHKEGKEIIVRDRATKQESVIPLFI